MEILGFIILLFFAAPFFYLIILAFTDTFQQRIRDRVAHNVLDDYDLQREKESIMNINKNHNFIVDTNRCPRCGSDLITRGLMVRGTKRRKEYFNTLICYKCNLSEEY